MKDDFVNKGLELGMSMMQRVMSHPTVGPMFMRAIRQTMELKQNLEQTRDNILERLQIASFQEQEHLRRNLNTVEKKLERLERRLREMQKKAKEAEKKAKEAEAKLKAQEDAAAEGSLSSDG
ncbi:MAG TPA: hypothetical protein DCE42_06250 [Myxococcales bacterium]|nr:hypothetical protein [Deltaproteobacteria bacterium]MBU47352.1 hypothetical protein [Deltaproteobacteria bacterium]HAA54336.1 hypothetical protein [Myxococcales bacterium]|tara:strand:- start:1420 stop:1785 length:366 start_codon:yes stop_codon:yes gene_type:complete